MAVPKPTGLSARHAPGWAYLTVPARRGEAQEVEYEDRGEWREAAEFGPEWLIPVHHPPARTGFRARYRRAGQVSEWTTGQVWTPDRPGDPGLSVDGDAPAPPAPYGLRNTWPATGTVELAWSQDEQVDRWRVVAVQDGATIADLEPVQPAAVVSGLAYDRPVTITVTAVRGEAESTPLTEEYPEAGWQPGMPQSLTVWPTETSFDLSWEQPDQCEQWQVLWRPADAVSGHSVEAWPLGVDGETGNVEVDGDPRYTITGLVPGREYELLIVARWRRSTYGEALIEQHATSGGGTGPRTPELRPGRITEDAIELLWDPDAGATGWWVRRDAGRHRPTAEPHWTATGLAPDTAYEFGVLAENEHTGAESAEAVIVLRTAGGTPPPSDPPSPPGGIRAHCIGHDHAKVEWDGNPDEEQVTHYAVTVVGEAERRVIGTLVELAELEPVTWYTVEVVACRDQERSRPATVRFQTGGERPPPDPDPPSGVPRPQGLYVDPVAPGRVRASWDRAADPATWWMATVDGGDWVRVVGSTTVELELPPGEQHTVMVNAAVDGGTGYPPKISGLSTAGVLTARKGY